MTIRLVVKQVSIKPFVAHSWIKLAVFSKFLVNSFEKSHLRTRNLAFIALLASVVFNPRSALAQPCFTADQCAQIRVNNERIAADQQAAQAAAEAARVRQEREVAREEAREHARQAAEQHQAQVEQERAQALRQVELLQAQAEARQRTQEAALREVEQRKELERLQAQRETDQAAAAVTRARQQAEEQSAYNERQRIKITEEENRAAAQLAAERSPDNYCHDKKTAGDLIDYYNGILSAMDSSNKAIDIEHLTTIRFDAFNQAMSCHGAFLLQDGRSVNGTITTRLNVAGRLLTEFHRD